jgi:hypothetical protein
VAEITLDTAPKLLEMTTQEMSRTANRGSEIDSRELTVPRFCLVAPAGDTLKDAPLLSGPIA